MKNGVQLISDERDRQIAIENFNPLHDTAHTGGELRRAAEIYLRDLRTRGAAGPAKTPPVDWPWEAVWFKPKADPVRQLSIVGALIAAEIDRLLRERGGGA